VLLFKRLTFPFTRRLLDKVTLLQSFWIPLFLRAFKPLVASALLGLTFGVACAQTKGLSTPAMQPDAYTTYLFAGIGGFIPASKSYSENYSTSLGGIPIEISGGLMFPVGNDVFVPFTVRYVRREANFVTGMSIEVTSIEPGVRFFFEHSHDREIRLFGGAELLLADASTVGLYDVSPNGTVTGMALAQRDYFNLGLGFDFGLTYPFTPTTALDLTVHLAAFLASPIADGGLGNLGGVSITGGYRFGF
jgi:hypothetical protein